MPVRARHRPHARFRAPACAAIALVAALAAGCGRDAGDGGKAPPAPPAAAGPSQRELDDAGRAIETFIAANRTREAEIVARKLAESTPDGAPGAATVAELASRAYFARAELAARELAPDERARLLAEAADLAIRAAEGAPNDATRARFAALLQDRLGNRDEAARLYDAALAASPRDLESLRAATLSAVAAGALDRARTLAARHADAAPDDAWSPGLVAEIALAAKDAPAAVAAGRVAVAADRDRVEFRLILARALRASGEPGEAARMLAALDAGTRAKPAITAQFAAALAESGDAAGAARAWDEALRANPAEPFVRAETALAFHRTGDVARAAAELDRLRAMPGAAGEVARVEQALRADARE
ncbi:MAG: hypothetical protein ACKO0W_02145 [Planctomycetota bacterium]